nr:hypothetical protein 5 - Theileria parva [Theileria parva]
QSRMLNMREKLKCHNITQSDIISNHAVIQITWSRLISSKSSLKLGNAISSIISFIIVISSCST